MSLSPTRLAIALALVTLAACAGDDATTPPDTDDDRSAPTTLALGAAKGDAPSWFVDRGTVVAGALVQGDFAGSDSAHLFRYQGVAGQRLMATLLFDLSEGRGAAVAIWGPEGALIDWAWAATGTNVSLTVAQLPADGAYRIGAFSLTQRATGDYLLDLTVDCGTGDLAVCSPGTLCRWDWGAGCGADGWPGTCRPAEAPHDALCDVHDDVARCHEAAECGDGERCVGRPSYLPDDLAGTDVARGCCLDTTALEGEGLSCAADADCGPGLICILGQCSPAWMGAELVSTPNASIPDDDPAGVSDTIIVACLASVPVTVHADVFITHSWVGDLEVVITDPSGDVQTTLWSREGGSDDGLELLDVLVSHTADDAVNGPWTLTVIDGAGYDTGALAEWRLRLTSRWD